MGQGITLLCYFYAFTYILPHKNKMAARAEINIFADSAFLNGVTHFKRKPLELSSRNLMCSYTCYMHGPRYVAIEFWTNPKNKMAATADFVIFLVRPIKPWKMHVSSPNLMCTSSIYIRCRVYIFGTIM